MVGIGLVIDILIIVVIGGMWYLIGLFIGVFIYVFFKMYVIDVLVVVGMFGECF